MSIPKAFLIYILTAVVFFSIDMLWLGFLAKDLYNKYLSNFMSDKINWTAAIIFYFIFILGIFYFCVFPAIEKNSLTKAIQNGLLFGLITYATYDLTNLATLKNWPLPIVFIDILWGMALTMLVSISGFLITKWLA
jgi:uncharacterized membrane protein